MYQITWFDMKGAELVVRKFKGALIAEDADTVTFTYRKKPMTLQKSDCTVWKWMGNAYYLAN